MSINVALIGATGLVGQKIIAFLSNDELFNIVEVVASEKKVGMKFKDACNWHESLCGMPEAIAEKHLISYKDITSNIIISCLPNNIAVTIETELLDQGKIIFSNSSAFRMDPKVPLIIREVNPNHITMIQDQPFAGKIITNPNCIVSGIAPAIIPLTKIAKIHHIHAVTLQSVSGAGSGLCAMNIVSNVIPNIDDESSKIGAETLKVLGSFKAPRDAAITVSVNRVPILYGHYAHLHVVFDPTVSVKVEDVKHMMYTYQKEDKKLFMFYDDVNRPQAALDLSHDDMRVHIGNIRNGGTPNVISFVVLVHNLVRGAAGALISNMKLCHQSYPELMH